MFKSLFTRQRWYEREGTLPLSQKPALVVLIAARCGDPAIVVDYLGATDEELTVRIGSSQQRPLEELPEDLAAVNVTAAWHPIRQGDPAEEERRVGPRIAKALDSVAEAAAGPGTGPSIQTVIETLGYAAANVQPPTAASSRTRAALADSYRKGNDSEPPF